MRYPRLLIILAATLCWNLTIEDTHGASIGINFVGGGEGPGGFLDPDETAGIPGFEQSNWNNHDGSSMPDRKFWDNSGRATSLTTPYGHNRVHDSLIEDLEGDFSLMKGSIDSTGILLRNIPYEHFDLIVYFSGQTIEYSQGRALFAANLWEHPHNSSYWHQRFIQVPPTFDGNYTETFGETRDEITPGNYVHLADLRCSGATCDEIWVSLDPFGNLGFMPLTGIQLIQVPEPSTWTLGIIGAIGVFLTYRRR